MVTKAIEIGDLNTRIKIFKEIKSLSGDAVPTTSKKQIRECFAAHLSSNIGEDEEGKIRAVYTDSFVIRRNKTNGQDDILLKNNIGLCIQKENDPSFYDVFNMQVEGRTKGVHTRADQNYFFRLNTVLRE